MEMDELQNIMDILDSNAILEDNDIELAKELINAAGVGYSKSH